MDSFFPRDSDTCTGSKQWYICTAGSFRGCCSSDPCTSGICPDDDASSTTSRSSDTLSITKAGSVNRFPDVTVRTAASTTTTLTEATTVSSATSSTTSSTISSITASVSPASSKSASTSTSKVTGVTALSSVLAATATHETSSPSSTPTSIPAAGSNLGAIIGGVVGGVAALALLAILIFCCIRRRRKQSKHEKQPTATSWYLHARKSRKARSEMKGPISPSSTDNTHPSVLLTPNIALSSSTNLISHPPHKIPTPPSNELYATIPPQELTPELQDTGFYRLRAELASHSQSELVNVPIDERRRRQTPIKTRLGPRAWESPTLAPIAGSPRASPVRESGNGHCRSHSAHASSSPTVVTSDGVLLGANLDRYSNGLEIARSLVTERGTAERDADHVMSFMQYGERTEVTALGTGDRPLDGDCSVERLPPADNMDNVENDVPPAYEAEESLAGPEIKSPSGRMGLSLRDV